ncbi:hypothetical protein GQ53DRAFT_755622 [Thozetella sp. PMI_491]|nr:hypothetical protein GQ53DRAFT_755622 [Thozetella sp. PMI_491]
MVGEAADGALFSDRLVAFLDTYISLRKMDPTETIMSLPFLGFVAETLRHNFGVTALRYGGSVSQARRHMVQQDFNTADATVPLLLTATSGGYDLNITEANIGIQTEL